MWHNMAITGGQFRRMIERISSLLTQNVSCVLLVKYRLKGNIKALLHSSPAHI